MGRSQTSFQQGFVEGIGIKLERDTDNIKGTDKVLQKYRASPEA